MGTLARSQFMIMIFLSVPVLCSFSMLGLATDFFFYLFALESFNFLDLTVGVFFILSHYIFKYYTFFIFSIVSLWNSDEMLVDFLIPYSMSQSLCVSSISLSFGAAFWIRPFFFFLICPPAYYEMF